MIRISHFDKELETCAIQKEIDHPLWSGLKVLSLADQKNPLSTLFTSKAYIPLGEGLYTSSSNHPFVAIWNLYKKSGKSFQGFQADILKNSSSTLPKEAKLAAAIALAKGDGYTDRDIVVRQGKGWREVATDIAVIFPRTTKYLGQGGFGVVREAQGYVVNPEENSFEKTTFALKEPYGEDAVALLSQGMKLLSKIWGPGLVRPSTQIIVPNGRKGVIIEWAMSIYTSDFRAWAKKHKNDPLKITKAFLTAFDGLKILQDHLVVHCDLKPQNLLVLENKDDTEVHINDFDGCFALPLTLDPESLWTFKEDLKDFSILRTFHYCRTADSRKLRERLTDLKQLLETEEADRDEEWFERFSNKLNRTSPLLKQIQIHEWGWTLITALTNTPPHNLVSTPSSSETDWALKEPSPEEVKKTVNGLDEGLKNILIQAVQEDPAARPTLETFKESVVNYLERNKIDQKVSSSKHGHLDGTLPTKPLLGKNSTGRAQPTLPLRAS